MPDKADVLYTIGYEGRSISGLVRVLKDAGVERLVDVRLLPHSRNRGFSLMGLFESLRKAGITYEHMGDLGNPPEIRSLFHDGQVEAGRAQFRTLLENGKGRVVDVLVGLCQLERTAILCRERDPEDCHRSVVAEVATERAPERLEVIHL